MKRLWYRLLDLWNMRWCDGCLLERGVHPHTCTGKHLYAVWADGDDIWEFGVVYRRGGVNRDTLGDNVVPFSTPTPRDGADDMDTPITHWKW